MYKLDTVKLYKLLHDLTVRNSDNGECFVDTRRLDKIEQELKGSSFEFCRKGKLFHAYAQLPFNELPKKLIVISSHVDFNNCTANCFSDETNADYVVGTYDNSITNAAIVTLMKEYKLPYEVVVVFTGDEEEEQGGASEFADFLNDELQAKVKCVVLDVTEEANEIGASFTIENDCWKKKWGEKILQWAIKCEMEWRYVPYKKTRFKKQLIQELVDSAHRASGIADMDETTTYYEANDIRCFSLCLPVEYMDPEGKYAPCREPMHSDEGLKVRKDAFEKYISALYEVIWVTFES